MDKIYIVTSGSYSDYSIEKVFMDLNKAQKFVELYEEANKWDNARIEEYEISDRMPQKLWVSQLYFWPKENKHRLEVEQRVITTYSRGSNDYEVGNLYTLVSVERYTKYEPKFETTEKHLLKVAQDLWWQIQEKQQIEGLSVEQISLWLKGQPIEE